MKRIKTRWTALLTAALMSTATVFMPTSTASAVNLNTAMSYYVYDADGDYLRQYTLSASPTLTAGPSTYAVIGDDSRVVDFSKSGVVKLMSTTAEYGYAGTGFIVDAHTIATAAHCVSKENATWSVNCQNGIDSILVFNGNGTVAETITDISEIHIPVEYTVYATTSTLTNESSRYDYALITVEDDLSDYACSNLGYMMDDFVTGDLNATVTGFPGEVNEKRVNKAGTHAMYTASGEIVSCNKFKIFHEIDSSGGNSGSPIYITTTFQNKTYYTVIGIHTFTDNNTNKSGGIRMNTNLLQFYKNNPNL